MLRVAWLVVAALSLPLIAHADQPVRTPLYGEHQQDWSLLDPALVNDIAIPPPGTPPESTGLPAGSTATIRTAIPGSTPMTCAFGSISSSFMVRCACDFRCEGA